jgi:hypothetical protein
MIDNAKAARNAARALLALSMAKFDSSAAPEGKPEAPKATIASARENPAVIIGLVALDAAVIINLGFTWSLFL